LSTSPTAVERQGETPRAASAIAYEAVGALYDDGLGSQSAAPVSDEESMVVCTVSADPNLTAQASRRPLTRISLERAPPSTSCNSRPDIEEHGKRFGIARWFEVGGN